MALGATLIQKCVSRLLLSGRENRGAVVHGRTLPACRAPKQEGGCTGTCVGGSGCASANGVGQHLLSPAVAMHQ